MHRLNHGVGVAALALTVAAAGRCAVEARAGSPCGPCGPCGSVAGATTPYGDTGCGPRYWGAVHDEPWVPDPCDGSGRWRGCNGVGQGPEMLAPWQLPPGRGLATAAQLGYDTSPCRDCARVGSGWGFGIW